MAGADASLPGAAAGSFQGEKWEIDRQINAGFAELNSTNKRGSGAA